MNKLRERFPLVATLIALLLPCGGRLAAAESFQLETNVYVFKNDDFQSVKLPAGKQAGDSAGVVIRSPATIEFDREKLSLAGADFSWSGGRNPPERFTLTRIPETMTGTGKPVEMVSTAPVQYLEKQADGTLQVRNIAEDSADAPHCRITFTIESPDEASGELRVSCNLDLATVSARENVPGVSLDVGRPLLARFQNRVELAVRSGEWAALLLRAPSSSDYSLLLLLKIMPAQTARKTAKADRPMTLEGFAEFATHYYNRPQPELIARAIESLGPIRILDRGRYHQNAYTCVGFFAEVFAANPQRVAEWQKVIDRRGGDTRFWLRKAMELRRPGAILAFGGNKPSTFSRLEEIFVFRGAFFASGNRAYLRMLIDRLEFVDDAKQSLFVAGAEAVVLLACDAHHHPLVPQTLEAARKDASPRTRELIGDLLTKDRAAVLKKLRDMDHYLPNPNLPAADELPWRRPLSPQPPPDSFSRGPN